MNEPQPQSNPFNAKLAWYEYIWITLPLILLVILGGAIGGACGGASWAVNKMVMGKTANPVLRFVWTGLISLAAIAIYLAVALLFIRSRSS